MSTLRRDPNFKKNYYETTAWSSNQLVCGIDEVGRGCLAGPVVTAAVIIHTKKTSVLLQDSKLLTHEQRLRAYKWIRKNCWFSTGIMHHRIIDTHNIYQSTLKAMKRAVMQLLITAPLSPAFILIDAMPLEIPTFEGTIYSFPFGESKSTSIAAASIVAKVTRDALMNEFDSIVPGYAFGKHKGYATPEHRRYLSSNNYSLIHRQSFIDHFHTITQEIPLTQETRQLLLDDI